MVNYRPGRNLVRHECLDISLGGGIHNGLSFVCSKGDTNRIRNVFEILEGQGNNLKVPGKGKNGVIIEEEVSQDVTNRVIQEPLGIDGWR